MEVIIDKNLLIKDSLFDPGRPKGDVVFYYKGPDNKFRYKVWIYLDGQDTYFVDHVTYKLHPSFSEPLKKVKRTLSNPNCSLVIWTWGIFNLEAEIVLKSGERITTDHYMSYDKQLVKTGLRFEEQK